MIMPLSLLLGYIFSDVCTLYTRMCMIVCMKVRINISISEEANNKLNLQPNKSQYLEDLILGMNEPSVPNLTEARVIELIQQYAPKQEAGFVPKPPDPILGYPCCQLKRPCKHWVWDSGLECYENTLTGEQRKDSSVIDVHEL